MNNTAEYFLAALLFTVVLAFFHYISPIILKRRQFDGGMCTSFAGGSAVAFVFLHMLPALIEHNEPVGQALSRYVTLEPVLDLSIFFVALFGFVVFFGVERFVTERARLGGVHLGDYNLHLVMFAVYNFFIAYTMPMRVETGLFFTAVFSLTIGLHFIFVDRNFNRFFSQGFSHSGRLILVLALMLGWLVSYLSGHINVILEGVVNAFLAGSVLYSVFREELPFGKGTSYRAFVVGCVIVALLLLGQAVFAGHGI